MAAIKIVNIIYIQAILLVYDLIHKTKFWLWSQFTHEETES